MLRQVWLIIMDLYFFYDLIFFSLSRGVAQGSVPNRFQPYPIIVFWVFLFFYFPVGIVCFVFVF